MYQHDDFDWQAEARCADRYTALFYTSRAAVSVLRDAALECCNAGGGCPARRQCLAFAITHNENSGTWGGMLERERGNLARTRCGHCHTLIGRDTIAAMVLEGRQHQHCATCGHWFEAIPSWEHPRRNSWISGTGRRT